MARADMERTAEARLAAQRGRVSLPEIRQQATLVERYELLQRLTGHDGSAILVAPPGYGKSVLLDQWCRRWDGLVARVTLEAAHDDLATMWALLLEKLPWEPDGIGELTRAAFNHPDQIMDTALPRLLNEVEAHAPRIAVVLDDFHHIASDECHRSIDLLLRHRPASMRVLISSRSELPLRLGRLRVMGELLELGASDLAFSKDELRMLASAHELDLVEGDIDQLHERTEGWPAGSTLALGSQVDSDPRNDSLMLDGRERRLGQYFEEEVMRSLTASEREFLVTTSVVDRMTGSLCDALTGSLRSDEILERFQRQGTFLVPLDETGDWYRYQHLFSEFLRADSWFADDDRLASLHRTAASWYSDAGMVEDSIRHFLASGEVECAVTTLSREYMTAIEAGDVPSVLRWLDHFPRKVISEDARLSVAEAWSLSFLQRYADAEAALENALASEYRGPLPDGASSVLASAALMAAFPRDDVGAMLSACHRAFEFEDREGSRWRGTVHMMLGSALLYTGDLDSAGPILERGAALSRQSERFLEEVGTSCFRAWVALGSGEVDDAEAWVDRAREAAAVGDIVGSPFEGYVDVTRGAVFARRGLPDQAIATMEKGISTMRGQVEPLMLAHSLLSLAGALLDRGHLHEAEAAWEEAFLLLAGFKDPGMIGGLLEETRVRLRGEPVAAGMVTTREIEVLGLLAEGLTKRQVADRLFVSYNTVHSHVKSVYRKLGAKSREDAVARARTHGLLELNSPG